MDDASTRRSIRCFPVSDACSVSQPALAEKAAELEPFGQPCVGVLDREREKY